MIDELASRLFAARDVAHREHLRTREYAKHVALGKFYEEVLDKADELLECWQGQYGMLPEFSVQTRKVSDISEYLRDEMDWIQSVRDVVCNGDAALENLVDGIVAVFLRTLLLLEMK